MEGATKRKYTCWISVIDGIPDGKTLTIFRPPSEDMKTFNYVEFAAVDSEIFTDVPNNEEYGCSPTEGG